MVQKQIYIGLILIRTAVLSSRSIQMIICFTWMSSVCCDLLGRCTKALSRRNFLIISMLVSNLTTRRLSGCATTTIKGSSSLFTVYCKSAVMSKNWRYRHGYLHELTSWLYVTDCVPVFFLLSKTKIFVNKNISFSLMKTKTKMKIKW